MQRKKPPFEHLNEVQRALERGHAQAKSAGKLEPSRPLAQPLYSLMLKHTLHSVSTDWQARPEVLDKARAAMVAALRTLNITDEAVLSAMAQVPRHVFVDEGFMHRAYDDDALPIGFEQTISHPSTVARMLGLMHEGARQTGEFARVLEIGTGCGYQTALLCFLARQVYSIERIEPLLQQARVHLTALRALLPIEPMLRFGDGMLGWSQVGDFDGIVLAAAGLGVPDALLGQLRIGGVLVAPVVQPVQPSKSMQPTQPTQHLVRITRTASDQWSSEYLDAVHFVPLLEGTQN